jgi:hypothetical protein
MSDARITPGPEGAACLDPERARRVAEVLGLRTPLLSASISLTPTASVRVWIETELREGELTALIDALRAPAPPC